MKLTNNLTIEQLLKTPFGYQFTQEQKSLILQAVEIGVEPAEIAKPEFDDEQMEEIRRGLESGIDVSQYVFPYLASPVMRQKRERLEYEQTLNM